KVSCSSPTEYQGLQSIVRAPGSTEIIHVQRTDMVQKYITGTYTLEILTYPRIIIPSVSIREGLTNQVMIPGPGKVEIYYNKDVIAGIFVQRDKGEDWC